MSESEQTINQKDSIAISTCLYVNVDLADKQIIRTEEEDSMSDNGEEDSDNAMKIAYVVMILIMVLMVCVTVLFLN